MRNILLAVLKFVHALVWFPLGFLLGQEFPLRLFRKKDL
ncbi:MAG: hypothetical protein ACI906_003088 [Candidatus Latescibacterota bacterium]|jgi:hypothetical protein